jgi:hypothetical protein
VFFRADTGFFAGRLFDLLESFCWDYLVKVKYFGSSQTRRQESNLKNNIRQFMINITLVGEIPLNANANRIFNCGFKLI